MAAAPCQLESLPLEIQRRIFAMAIGLRTGQRSSLGLCNLSRRLRPATQACIDSAVVLGSPAKLTRYLRVISLRPQLAEACEVLRCRLASMSPEIATTVIAIFCQTRNLKTVDIRFTGGASGSLQAQDEVDLVEALCRCTQLRDFRWRNADVPDADARPALRMRFDAWPGLHRLELATGMLASATMGGIGGEIRSLRLMNVRVDASALCDLVQRLQSLRVLVMAGVGDTLGEATAVVRACGGRLLALDIQARSLAAIEEVRELEQELARRASLVVLAIRVVDVRPEFWLDWQPPRLRALVVLIEEPSVIRETGLAALGAAIASRASPALAMVQLIHSEGDTPADELLALFRAICQRHDVATALVQVTAQGSVAFAGIHELLHRYTS